MKCPGERAPNLVSHATQICALSSRVWGRTAVRERDVKTSGVGVFARTRSLVDGEAGGGSGPDWGAIGVDLCTGGVCSWAAWLHSRERRRRVAKGSLA